jgi:hypothetical protein
LGKLPDLKEAVSRALGRKVNVRLNGAAINNKEEGGDKAETEEAVKPWNPVEEPIVRHMLNLFEGQIIKGDLG